MERLEFIKDALKGNEEIDKSDIEWLVLKFEELQIYTKKTRERWVDVHKRNQELEKQLKK